jgi:hypothetical protein
VNAFKFGRFQPVSEELQSDARKGPQSVDNLQPISENPGDFNAFTLPLDES